MRDFLRELKRRNVLRVTVGYLALAWLVIQVLETVFPIFGIAEGQIRWVVILLAILVVPVMALSWTFEWSGAGIVSQADVDRGAARPRRETRRFDRIVIVVLSIAVIYFAVDIFLLNGVSTGVGGRASIAVLPFADQTAAGDSAYLADGLAEEVLNLLARNPGVRVVARSSSFRFRNAGTSVEEIARQLNVSHILEGSIRNLGDRLRISVQLVSGDDGFNVWSQAFDRSPDDIFRVSRDIRLAVERTLDIPLDTSGEEERAPDPEAYALALRANYLSKDSSTSGRREAVELYRQALDIDANLGVVWSNLATTYINQVIAGEIDWNEGYRNSRDAAIRAISVTPGHPAGYTSLSFIQRYFEGDLPAAISNMELALQKDPHGIDVLAEASVLLMNIGQLDEAVRLQEEIVERSPVDVISVWNLALRYRYADRLEESERMYQRVLELSPEYATINYNLGETLLLMGEFQKAADYFAKEDDEAYRIKGMALTQFSLGRYGEADRSLEQLIEKYGERWPSEVAHVYAWRGEIDPAFDWLEKEYDTYGAGGWGEWQLQRLYDNLRDDPRWNAFLTRTGTSPEQLASLSLRLPGASK